MPSRPPTLDPRLLIAARSNLSLDQLVQNHKVQAHRLEKERLGRLLRVHLTKQNIQQKEVRTLRPPVVVDGDKCSLRVFSESRTLLHFRHPGLSANVLIESRSNHAANDSVHVEHLRIESAFARFSAKRLRSTRIPLLRLFRTPWWLRSDRGVQRSDLGQEHRHTGKNGRS